MLFSVSICTGDPYARKDFVIVFRIFLILKRIVFESFDALIYRVSQEERAKLREVVPYVKLYRYNPKHLYLKLNGYGDNGQ